MQHTFLQPFDVVLSHSRPDTATAAQLAAELRAAAVAVWTGDYLRRDSDYWQSSVEQALAACGKLVLVLGEQGSADRSVNTIIRLALKVEAEIFPVWVGGSERAAIPPSLRQLQRFDVRAAVAAGGPVLPPALRRQLHTPDEPPPPVLHPVDPRDQFKLLLWSLRRPQTVLDFQQRGDILSLRRTAGWLAASLLAAYFSVELLMDALAGLRPQLGVGVLLVVGLWWLLGSQQRSALRIASYRWSAIGAALGTTLLIPLVLALMHVEEINAPDPGVLLMPLFMLGVGGLALALLETYQVRGLVLPFVTFVTAAGFALSTTQSLASNLARAINHELGTIAALTGIAASVSILSILVLYALSFLLAEDMINAIYTRSQPARFAGIVLTVLPLTYVLVVLVELL